jgi:hypothetical protein
LKDVAQSFHSKQTGIGEDRPETLQAVKIDLTRHIASTLDGLQDEVRYAFNKELGLGEGWTPVVLYGTMARIVALLSGRVFVGRPLSRDEEWIEASIKYTMDCVNARTEITKYPVYLRNFVAPFLPEIRRVKQYSARGGKLLEPVLKAALAREREEKKSIDDSEDEQGTFVSWVLKHTTSKAREDPKMLASHQMTCKSFQCIDLRSTGAHTPCIQYRSPRFTQRLPARLLLRVERQNFEVNRKKTGEDESLCIWQWEVLAFGIQVNKE